MLSSFRSYHFQGGLQRAFSAKASITATTVYTTATTVGLSLFNPVATATAKGVTAYLLAVGWGVTVASTVAGSIGVAVGQSTAPGSTGASDLTGALNPLDTQAAGCSAFKAGIYTAAPTAYVGLGAVDTGAITTIPTDDNFVHLGGMIVVPPGCYATFAASATLTTSVIDQTIVWVEVVNN